MSLYRFTARETLNKTISFDSFSKLHMVVFNVKKCTTFSSVATTLTHIRMVREGKIRGEKYMTLNKLTHYEKNKKGSVNGRRTVRVE